MPISTVGLTNAVNGVLPVANGGTGSSTALVPSGAVMNFAMSTAPTGWLACDGTAISRTTYASLFSAIGTTFGSGNGSTTFNLPNLGGQFTRNWISGQSTDSGRTFGSTQTDAFQGHKHAMDNSGPFGVPFPSGGLQSSGGGAAFQTAAVGNPSTDGSNGTPRTASETRPTNVALLACIKI